MIVSVIGPPVSCQVFLFGDAKVSKKKDAMLMLSCCLMSKYQLYIFQLNRVLRDMGTALGGLLEVLVIRGLLKISQKRNIR